MKVTLWVEQYKQMPWHHPSVREFINSVETTDDESPVDFQARAYDLARKEFGRGYVVTKAQNLTEPGVGDWINQREIDRLISQSVVVNISLPKSE